MAHLPAPLQATSEAYEAWVRYLLPEARDELNRRLRAGDFIANPDGFIRNHAAAAASKKVMRGEEIPHPTALALTRHIASGRARLAQGEAA